MSDSCSICGLILAPQDSDNPEWCKDIRALCWFNGRPVLSGQGYKDEDPTPFLLPVPALNRFYVQRNLNEKEDSCYPFHTACWTILEEVAPKHLFIDSIEPLYEIFEGCHYKRKAHALSWGHNYYLEDILDPSAMLADPLLFDFTKNEDRDQAHLQPEILPSEGNSTTSSDPPLHSRLLLLPTEIIHSIMCSLPFSDNKHLLQAIKRDLCDLPSNFWESRFRVNGESGFARSICPPDCSWKEWFFVIHSEISSGLFQMNLQNRKRIWRIAVDLVDMVQTIQEPQRALYGDTVTLIPAQRPCSTVSCLALEHDLAGCRVLTRRSVYWGERSAKSQLYDVTPSYVYVSDQRLVSGLKFMLSSGSSVDVGYLFGRHARLTSFSTLPEFLWLVASPLGIETVALDVYPDSFLAGAKGVAVSKWKLENLRGVSLGLDAIRVVSICPSFGEQNIGLDHILWEPPYPSPIPSMIDDDVMALHNLQSKSFTPASTLCIRPENGRLVAIKVYAPLGRCAGITGIRFVYDTGMESIWGSDFDAASLSFFLHDLEHLSNVMVYKIDSLVYHLQFTTNLHRKSEVLPPMEPGISFDCVAYRAVNGGSIVGFCGCFSSSQQLNCFGVIPSTTLTTSKSSLSRPISYAPHLYNNRTSEMPLGNFRQHGQFKCRFLLDTRIQSIQASVNTGLTKYRPVGQITGLLFRTENSSYPELLGQLTGPGKTYDLEEGEWIVNLKVRTTKPIFTPVIRPGLSQIEGIAIVTNRRKIEWGIEVVQTVIDRDMYKQKVSEITWEFNAVFDRVQWSYKPD